MHRIAVVSLLVFAVTASAADVESRVLTHYVPQDLLETAVRTEGWTEVPLKIAGGPRKGDVVRIWTGGSIDRGNGDQPGDNINGPDGLAGVSVEAAKKLALSPSAEDAFALLVKTDSNAACKCRPAGKPLEIKLTKDNEKLWIGFNDERGRYQDNHLGKGRHHELDPLWLRVEVVRIIVD
jgi:hypothetical protein